MNTHAWLATAHEVQAMLEGRLTMFFRPVEPQPSRNDEAYYPNGIHCHKLEHYESGVSAGYGFESEEYQWKCPYGVPGDRLIVKETWYNDVPEEQDIQYVEYRATHNCRDWEGECPCRGDDGRSCWRPSSNMPRWASRLTREVVKITAPLLQEISTADITSLGVDNGNRPGLDWASNPRVWAVTVKEPSE